MAAKKTAVETPEAKPAQEPVKSEPKYTLAALKEHSKSALGVEQSVMDGAFSGVADDTQLTVTEAKSRIDAFMAKPIPRRSARR